MNSQVEKAIADALAAGQALCKFISRTDVGANGAHQCGYYLPKQQWRMFTPKEPKKGINHESPVHVVWPDGITTESMVKWYGVGTRSEFRLTRFGRGFPWMDEDFVGSLILIIPFSLELFHAYVFETEEEIELVLAALGVETLGGVAVYQKGVGTESENDCLKRVFHEATQGIEKFPTGEWMATKARNAVVDCSKGTSSKLAVDVQLLKWVAAEYQLYRNVESKLCLPDIQGGFADVDAFISLASTIMNRRKSRAGHSLEYHVEHMLKTAGLEFESQAKIDGKVRPDILIPGKAAYEDKSFPESKLLVVGIKTTCKDRWRQILNEGKRVKEKHLLTLQEAISKAQLLEMKEANVTLVVPKPYHKGYDADTGIKLLTISDFMNKVKELAA